MPVDSASIVARVQGHHIRPSPDADRVTARFRALPGAPYDGVGQCDTVWRSGDQMAQDPRQQSRRPQQTYDHVVLPTEASLRRRSWYRSRPRALLTGAGSIAVLAVVVAAFLANTGIPTAGHPTAGAPVFPQVLAGASLVHALQGPRALGEVARLHGRRIDAADAVIGHYEGGIVLWMTRSRNALRATTLLWRMNRRMAGGTAVFTSPQAKEVHGRTAFTTTGLGARHFYYQSGSRVLWLQAPERLATSALQDLLAHYP
ncbi:MAG: hypothetical protein QN152_01715 [Armatimonadota bacterium]|nr:hypothetical protein [Armatimonadota bacterium]MDR7463899.1 hypothetical protein [Armatimonadota bacterium]MDR7470069.1 hypothetical protein [Armatimonadota bacterium]MDR7474409.1 hypothetical protein [Armatimonadota bacterium]MDR7538237.1 hypothetical protein [Armatimonadota bacterium]